MKLPLILFAAFPVIEAFSPAASARTSVSLHASNANEFFPMRPGSSVALVTPFDKVTGKVDFPALRRLLQFHVHEGTDNLCILGTTGEASVLSMAEREQVLKTAVEEVKGKMAILAGCGTINPNSVKAMTQQAMDVGCDASLLVTPYYVKPPQRCLIQHAITSADYGLPIILYNVPGRTGVNFLDKSMAVCAQHENIVGVKDATGDLNRLSGLKQALKDENYDGEFLFYSGDDATTIDFVLNGGDGCISVTANVAPQKVHNAVMAALHGKEAEAREIDATLQLLHKNLFCEANPIPAKWAVYRMGLMDTPACRPPLDSLDPSLESLVEQALEVGGCLKEIDLLHEIKEQIAKDATTKTSKV